MFVAGDIAFGVVLIVNPVAVVADSSRSVLFIVDSISGKGMWLEVDGCWYLDTESARVEDVAECIEGVVGEDAAEWRAVADERLAEYGFRLGECDGVSGDRFELVDITNGEGGMCARL